MKLYEVSKNTKLDNSWDKDLVKSKEWLADELARIDNKFGNVYVLGSWYGNLSIILFKERDIQFNTLYNVDVERTALEQGQALADELGMANIKSLHRNANYIEYNQPSLVINTSVNNMENAGWFDNIPQGTLVVLQSRNNDPQALNACNSAQELALQYPLSQVLFQDKIRLTNKLGSYARFMVIGVK